MQHLVNLVQRLQPVEHEEDKVVFHLFPEFDFGGDGGIVVGGGGGGGGVVTVVSGGGGGGAAGAAAAPILVTA